MQTQISNHFNKIASDYEYWKKKNWYYYNALKQILKEEIKNPQQINVLEIGCGTGDLIASIESKQGIGIDISKKMIEIAKNKHTKNKNLIFLEENIQNTNLSQKFDYIIMADVIEHLSAPENAIKSFKKLSHPDTRIIITMANPIWEPILLILEKLNLKMPEGPHKRLSSTIVELLLAKYGFQIKKQGFRLLVPAYIPIFSNFINDHFYKIPFIKKLGLVTYFIIKNKS